MCSPSPSPTNFTPATPMLTSFRQPPASSYSWPACFQAPPFHLPPRPPLYSCRLSVFSSFSSSLLSSSPQPMNANAAASLSSSRRSLSSCLPPLSAYSALSPVVSPLLPPALPKARSVGCTVGTPRPDPVGTVLVPVRGLTAAPVRSLLPTTLLL